MMYKPITRERLTALTKLYERTRAAYDPSQQGNLKLVDNPAKQQSAESSALVVVANALMNMDEWITKN
jgi:hypothetical protein